MIKIFLSYSHEDESYKANLDKHLVMLKRNQKVETWNDRKILPGQEWDEAIARALHEADIILLLVSIDFLASQYIWDKELAIALKRHQEGSTHVVPIILRKCDWQDSPFSKLQALPKNAQAISSWSDSDEAYLNVVRGIRELVEQI